MADLGSGFTSGAPEVPQAPLDLPTPSIPAADFIAIGKQQKEGERDSGFWQWLLRLILDWIPDAVGAIVGALLGLVEMVVAYFLRIYLKIFRGGEFGADEIAADAVTGITGIPVSSSVFQTAAGRGARAGAAHDMAAALLQAITGFKEGATGGAIEPSDEGAKRFLDFATHLQIEGWLQGWLMEAMSLHHITELGELKDALEHAWGLSRLARRAWAAPVRVFIEEPFTRLLNKTYFPTLLTPEILVRQYLRGIITAEEMRAALALHGYSPAQQDALVNYSKLHISAADVVTLLEHNSMDRATAEGLLKAQGYDEVTAGFLIEAEQVKRAQSLAMTNVDRAIALWEQGRLLTADVHAVIDHPLGTSSSISFEGVGSASGGGYQLSPVERQAIETRMNIIGQVARPIRELTISEAQQMVEKGIWSIDQFQKLLLDRGYTPGDATDLELLLLGKIKDEGDAIAKKNAAARALADRQAAAAKLKADKAAAAAAAAEARGLAIAKYEALVLGGEKTIADYQAFLRSKGIATDNITALVSELQGKLDKAAAAQSARAAGAGQAKQRGLNLAELDKAVEDGLIPTSEFRTRLQQAGFNDGDIAILEGELAARLDAAKQKAQARVDAQATASTKHINLSTEVRAVRLGVVSVDQYQQFLAAHGFTPEDIAVLVADVQAQLDADKAASKAKGGVAAAAKQRGISLQQEERLVRAGVKPIADYRTLVLSLGYAQADADALTQLLQLQMDQDQETLAARGRAAALPTDRVLSLPELEKLARAGSVPVTVYTDALVRSGVSQADADALTAALAAGVKGSKAGLRTVTAAARSLKQVGIDLTALEKDVLAGRLTPEQLGGVLAGSGLPPDDVNAILTTVQDALDNQEAVARLMADAGNRAAAKGLTLAQETTAVGEGVKTLEEYAAFVAGLGYDPADAATLVATEAAKLAKLAAPKAKPAPAPATTRTVTETIVVERRP